MRLSVVVPLFNERASIDLVVERVLASPHTGELVIVDDGSTDGSAQRAVQLARQDGRVRVLRHRSNRGKGAAVRSGVAACTEAAVLIQDADLEYDPREHGRLLAPVASGHADVVYGSRYLGGWLRGEQHLLYRLANLGLTWVCNRTTGLTLTDMETCYKCFRREVIQSFDLVETGFGIEVELTAKTAASGVRIVEVPISYTARRRDDGKKIGFLDGLEALRCIYAYGREARRDDVRAAAWAPEGAYMPAQGAALGPIHISSATVLSPEGAQHTSPG